MYSNPDRRDWQMPELSQQMLLVVVALAGLFVGLQLLLTIGVILTLKSSARERAVLNKETFGLVKRLEGLTATRREQILKHYDSILDQLSNSLPPTIAAHTSQLIFETESKILTRLAELEPNLRTDDASRRKMDELIKSMETLEKTIVALASDTVRRVMNESRRTLLDDSQPAGMSLAA